MNNSSYLKLEPNELLETLTNTFIYEIPCIIDDTETLNSVSKLMGDTVNQYSFLAQLYSFAKLETRRLKRLGPEFKTDYENSVDRKEIIKNILDSVLLRYKALSRMVTIKQEINNELKMSDIRM